MKIHCSNRKLILQIRVLFFVVSFLIYISSNPVLADICESESQLIVVEGKQIPDLLSAPINKLSVKRWDGNQFQAIIFQIDQKDQNNRYLLSVSSDEIFDANDELVFLKHQSGQRYKNYQAHKDIVGEITLSSAESDKNGWVYVFKNHNSDILQSAQLIKYDSDNDKITTDKYQAGFSSEQPFLIDDFWWRNPVTGSLSDDLVDTMKIRHKGRFMGLFGFRRSQQDYISNLVSVKQGPLRIIRRTENRVRVFWKLRSPSLLIDYVMTPDGFTMDTLIDMPFRIGAFFRDLETITTVDWNKQAAFLKLAGFAGERKFQIDGAMSDLETGIGQQLGKVFQLQGMYGSMHIVLDIPTDLPLQSWKYYVDDSSLLDPPEIESGQIGNTGFRTTGWENLGSGISHVDFSVCMATN